MNTDNKDPYRNFLKQYFGRMLEEDFWKKDFIATLKDMNNPLGVSDMKLNVDTKSIRIVRW